MHATTRDFAEFRNRLLPEALASSSLVAESRARGKDGVEILLPGASQLLTFLTGTGTADIAFGPESEHKLAVALHDTAWDIRSKPLDTEEASLSLARKIMRATPLEDGTRRLALTGFCVMLRLNGIQAPPEDGSPLSVRLIEAIGPFRPLSEGIDVHLAGSLRKSQSAGLKLMPFWTAAHDCPPPAEPSAVRIPSGAELLLLARAMRVEGAEPKNATALDACADLSEELGGEKLSVMELALELARKVLFNKPLLKGNRQLAVMAAAAVLVLNGHPVPPHGDALGRMIAALAEGKLDPPTATRMLRIWMRAPE